MADEHGSESVVFGLSKLTQAVDDLDCQAGKGGGETENACGEVTSPIDDLEEDFDRAKFRFVETLGPGENEDSTFPAVERMPLDLHTAECSNQNEDVKGEVLLQWLKDNGAYFPCLDLVQYETEVRGVHASAAIKADQLLLSVPLKCLMTIEMGKACDLGRAVAPLIARGEFTAPNHILLMMILLTELEKGEGSFYYPFIATLPRQLNNMPVFWNKRELQMLQGSYILKQIADRRAFIKSDYRKISETIPGFSARFSLQTFMWARMIVASRNFGIVVASNRTAALVPMADMLNHYRPRETSWTFDQQRNEFTLTSLTPISCGDQVYDSYGRKCNHRFLLNYGFAIENNCDPDGRNPNGVMLFFDFKAEEPEKLTSRKRKFLSYFFDFPISARLFGRHDDTEVYSLARILAASEEELNMLPRDLDALEIEPISIRNEIEALNIIAFAVNNQLASYATTLEEDRTLLKPGALPPFSNARHAKVFLVGEKEVCTTFLELQRVARDLFSAPSEEELVNTVTLRFSGYDDISRYVQDVVVPLAGVENLLDIEDGSDYSD